MDETAFLVNIATLLTKDVGFDSTKVIKPLQANCILYDNGDNSDQYFFNILKRRKKKKKTNLKINLGYIMSTDVFQSSVHITKESFYKIFDVLLPIINCSRFKSSTVPRESLISIGLWKLATDEHFEQISRRFKISLDMCQFMIRSFWYQVSIVSPWFIQWPSLEETDLCENKFTKHVETEPFSKLFALVATKRLDIFLESEDEETSVIFQIIVDADEKIIDCYVDLAATYDFEKSPISKILENYVILPKYSYLIGDKTCPLKKYLIKPFDHPKQEIEIEFNKIIEQALMKSRIVVQKMAKRFNTLYALEAKDLLDVQIILQTVCVIHNLCQTNQDDCLGKITAFDKSDSLQIKGNDSDVHGKKRRFDLMNEIIKSISEI